MDKKKIKQGQYIQHQIRFNYEDNIKLAFVKKLYLKTCAADLFRFFLDIRIRKVAKERNMKYVELLEEIKKEYDANIIE